MDDYNELHGMDNYDEGYGPDTDDEVEYKTIEVVGIRYTTAKAYLFESNRGDFWMPISICEVDKNYINSTIMVAYPDWHTIEFLEEDNYRSLHNATDPEPKFLSTIEKIKKGKRK